MFKSLIFLAAFVCVIAVAASSSLDFFKFVNKNADASIKVYDNRECKGTPKKFVCDGKCIPFQNKFMVEMHGNGRINAYPDANCQQRSGSDIVPQDECIHLEGIGYQIASINCENKKSV